MLWRAVDSLWSVFFGSIQRMLFGELLRIFFLCLTALCGMFTMIAILQQFQFGLSLNQVLRILPLLMPSSIPWITPPACLFAACVVYGRLAHDNEAVALKAAGVNLHLLLLPALGLGLLTTLGTTLLQFQFTPYAVRQTKELVIANPQESISLALKKERQMQIGNPNERESFTLFVRDVQDLRLLDVVAKIRKPTSTGVVLERVARTREATIQVDLENKKVRLVRGTGGDGGWVYWSPNDSQPGIIQTDALEFDLPERFSLDYARADLSNNEMSLDWSQLLSRAEELRVQREVNVQLVKAISAYPSDRPLTPAEQFLIVSENKPHLNDVPADPGLRENALRTYEYRVKDSTRLERKMVYEYHARLATGFACLFFSLLGCPVGLWASRSDYLSIFVICFIPALIIYYPMIFMVGGYARDGRIPMLLGVWTANGVLAGITLLLIWRLMKR